MRYENGTTNIDNLYLYRVYQVFIDKIYKLIIKINELE